MLNLMKYEFRKDRNTLLVIGGGLLLLQLIFMYCCFTKNEDRIIISTSLLVLWAVVCFFSIFILSITNYSRELNSKSSYLIFMTPNSSFSIIFSKLLTILLLGIAVAAIFVGLAAADVTLVHSQFPETETFTELITDLLNSAGIPVDEILLSIVTGILTFLVEFFSTVALAYLAVTLCLTFLQNSRLRIFLSVVLFLALNYVTNRIANELPLIYDNPDNVSQLFISILPATGFSFAVLVLCIAACGILLDKKVSL